MKAKLFTLVLCIGACVCAQAQGAPLPKDPHFLTEPGWNFGVWADYVNGVGTRTGVHAGGAGVRIGRVLTHEHGGGLLRGTLEYDVDLTPVEIYHLPSYTERGTTVPFPAKNYYTGGVNPFVAKWNFTNHVGQGIVPYFAAEGGVIFSNGNLPQGDTASVNFTSGAAFGMHVASHSGNAWTFQGKVFHLSNASIGNHNPGVNAALQFKIGYTWFK